MLSIIEPNSNNALVCSHACPQQMTTVTSDEYYGRLCHSYEDVSKTRSRYLESIDNIVVSAAKICRIDSWLDIGVGDGKRLSKLLRRIEADDVVCLEPSSDMYQEALRNLDCRCTVVEECLSKFSQNTVRKFSFVTALWNVIGHADNHVLFLRDAYELLDKESILLIDANNRYNICQYGLFRVIRNALLDYLGLSSKGIFRLETRNKGEYTQVYIASPNDIRSACKNLKIENISIDFINYSTGKSANLLTGQMVITITKS